MINEINKIKEQLNHEKIGPVFFVTPNPNRAIGLEKEIKNYHIICSQNTDLVDYLKKEKVSVLCIDETKIKNSGKLLENKEVLSYIKKESKGGSVNIITFKPSPKISKICAENDFRYLGSDWRLNRKFENKIIFVEITEKLKIPNAKSKVIKLEKKNSDILNKLEKENLVFQLPRGYSGNSTFLIKNKKDYQEILEKYEGRQFKVSKYLEGDTYTINACVTRFGIAVSQPIFQITGLIDYNKNKLGTSGNDYEYNKNLSKSEKKKIFDYTKKVGEYLSQSGYQGIFGLDYIVNKEAVDLIEINPRLVGSIPVYTNLQLQKEETPFLYLQILEFLKIEYSPELLNNYLFFDLWIQQENFHFSQLILRNTKENDIIIKKKIISGIYKFQENKLLLQKKKYFAYDLKDDEFLVQTAKKGSSISPDTEYANLQFGYGIMKGNKLKRSFAKKINLIVGEFGL